MQTRKTESFQVREIQEISKISRNRQITIPKNIAEMLKIAEGDKIRWVKCVEAGPSPHVYNITLKVIQNQEEST